MYPHPPTSRTLFPPASGAAETIDCFDARGTTLCNAPQFGEKKDPLAQGTDHCYVFRKLEPSRP